MSYHFENVRLEKGMYGRSGKSFTRTLEELDPSERYRGTPLEGLDAFQRQLKRFDIRRQGGRPATRWRNFSTPASPRCCSLSSSPGWCARVWRRRASCPTSPPSVTKFDGMDYRSIASNPTEEEKKLLKVEEGATIPQTVLTTQENLVKLHKRGRMLVASYEAIRFQKLDLFSVTLRQIGAQIGRMHLEDAIHVIISGDGNDNAAQTSSVSTAGKLTYEDLLAFWNSFEPYQLNTLLVGTDTMPKLLGLSQMQDAAAGLDFHGTGRLITPWGQGAAHLRRARGQDHRPGQKLRPGDGQGGRRDGGVRQAHRPADGTGRHHHHIRLRQDL